MKKIELVEEKPIEETIKVTEQELLEMIIKDGLIFVLQNYDVPESFLLKWGPKTDEFDGLDKNIIIQIMGLSEKFIKDAIDIDYFELDDIYGLNMGTYSGLSEKFIKLYENYINWERMILYLCSSEKIDDISKFEWIIEKFNLWKLISANELPIDFVRRNRNKLDWRIVSIINDFSDEEKDEFVEDIPNYKEEWDKLAKESDNFTIMPESIKSDNLSIKDIRKMINSNVTKEDEGNRFEVKHTMDKLTNDDLLQIKEMIQSGKINKF
jgi:hypothetical protein